MEIFIIKANVKLLKEILNQDFITTDKQSIPFSDEIKLIRIKIQERLDKLELDFHRQTGKSINEYFN